MTLKTLPLPQTNTKKTTTWRITNQKGDVYTVEGTDIVTEEDNTAIHVYDKSTCIFVIFDAKEVVALDERVSITPKPRRKKKVTNGKA
jgi:hypothetical protein